MAAAAPVNANLIVRYLPAYQNAQGVQTMFLIAGGTDMEYEGVIDGTENVPIYNRQFAGAMQPMYAGNQADAALYHMIQVQQHAQLPEVGDELYCWWPQEDGFAAGFYRCRRLQ